jgi:hypothetical protein
VFPALLMLHYDRALDVQVIELIFQDFKEGRILTAVDADTLEFVSEVLFDWELFEGGALHDNVVFALKDETVHHEVLSFE